MHLLNLHAARLYRAGKVHEALDAYRQIIESDPSDVVAHSGIGMCWLLLGDFQNGWGEYEWRLLHPRIYTPPTGLPRWNGQALKGKTILIRPEQGYGDTIQFSRYARYVKALGATVLLGCQDTLNRLLRECAGVDRIINHGDFVELCDLEVPLLSLPRIFNTTLDTIPADISYLSVPRGANRQAIAIIASHKRETLRVGLVWSGDSQHSNNQQRSLKPEQLGMFIELPNVKFFSLQKGDPAQELKSISHGSIIDLGTTFNDFADTAAAIQELDLVISIDTAVAHLAGALGKPVWTLIPFAPDWRWMLNREDSPWYPTMRLFRQPAPGDWASVIRRVAEELKNFVGPK